MGYPVARRVRSHIRAKQRHVIWKSRWLSGVCGTRRSPANSQPVKPTAILLIGYNFATSLYVILRTRRARLVLRGDSHRLARRAGPGEYVRRRLISLLFAGSPHFCMSGRRTTNIFVITAFPNANSSAPHTRSTTRASGLKHPLQCSRPCAGNRNSASRPGPRCSVCREIRIQEAAAGPACARFTAAGCHEHHCCSSDRARSSSS